MRKSDAVAALGPQRLSWPAWVKAALAANDRLKCCLTLLQAAAAHAEHPAHAALDLKQELSAVGLHDAWLQDIPSTASLTAEGYFLPELPRLAERLATDLGTMARPVLACAPADAANPWAARTQAWLDQLQHLRGDHLTPADLQQLTQGHRHDSDSLHLLVMDLHKQLNHLAADLTSEEVDGARVWQLGPGDHERVAAFMRGLHRTAPLKLNHPGLDTAATRDGDVLLIQNDIGTNDAHVLVMKVSDTGLTLTYSDLHRSRFDFFARLLAEHGAVWSVVEPQVSPGLNQGDAFWVGTARFEVSDEAALQQALDSVGGHIVFLIDWNRARKRLQALVDKPLAVAVLDEAARQAVGHMAWLQAGGERLVFDAMQRLGEDHFRLGDRLDEVLGTAPAQAFLVAVLTHASHAALAGLPTQLVADQTDVLLAQHVQQHSSGFALLGEHAAYCQTLAQRVRDGLAHGLHADAEQASTLAARAKAWERRADHLVMQARERADRLPHWRPLLRVLEGADDVADALEEAAFMLSLIAEGHHRHWHHDVRDALQALANTVLDATQEHVRALAIAANLGGPTLAADTDAFLAATWQVVKAERLCDELLRQARRVVLQRVTHAAALMLANDLAMTLELASDRLLTTAYALRHLVLHDGKARA